MMKYKLPLSFRRIITKLWQLPYIGVVILCIAAIGAMHGSINTIPEQIYNWFTVPQTYSGSFWISDLILLCVAIFASFFFGSIIKYCYYKPRPEPQKYNNRWQKIDASSFPSIHTANSLILAFFGIVASGGVALGNNTSLVQQIIVQIILPVFWWLFYLTISYSRVVLKKHYWIDLLGGTIFAALILAWVVWQADIIISTVWKICHLVIK